jgi:hypothetical protein
MSRTFAVAVLALLAVGASAQSSSPFYCCHYQSQALSSLLAQACTWDAVGCDNDVSGWTLKKSTRATYGCSECTVFDDSVKLSEQSKVDQKALQQKLASKPAAGDAPAAAKKQASNYPCCLYSNPQNGWIKPIETVCNNPAVHLGCEEQYEGLTKAGQWRVLEMFNQVRLVPPVSPRGAALSSLLVCFFPIQWLLAAALFSFVCRWCGFLFRNGFRLV